MIEHRASFTLRKLTISALGLGLMAFIIEGNSKQVSVVQQARLANCSSSSSRPSWQLGKNQRDQLLKAVQRIRLGDSRSEVLKLLGPPTNDYRASTDRWPSKRFHCLVWYISIWNKTPVNELHDELIQVYLDDDLESLQELDVYLSPRRPRGEPSMQIGNILAATP